MDLAQPQNTRVLSYLSRENPLRSLERRKTPIFASCDSAEDPYYACGCHPEIVERLWDRINPLLTADSRCLIYGDPALVHPASGVILAIGLGTQYGLYLPQPLASQARSAGAATSIKWSTGDYMDIQLELGEDWVFGAWLPNELIWCQEVFEKFNQPA